MQTQTIGIAGSGVMGGGIAQMFAECGHQVVVWDVNAATLAKGVGAIESRLAQSVEKSRITRERAAEIMSRIKPAGSFDEFKDAGLVVEAVLEDLAVKKAILRQLEPAVADAAVLATNTSSLSVSALAAELKKPSRFMGLHFFNPPTKLELVEVVPAGPTDRGLLTGITALLRSCGKTPVIVKDVPGFIVNRLLLLLINEAARMVDEGVASAEDIDTAMKLGALHPAGPLAVADLIGLDTCKKILDVLRAAIKESSYQPAAAIENCVAAGKLGRKSREGFFKYQ